MVRWQPDSRGRLEQAALALYGERGFENTTVAEIAERAGLTERTFFRHFADKREVLFGGAGGLQGLMVSAVAEAPADAAPIDAVMAALVAAGDLLQQRRDFARQRQEVIVANAELRERELIKMATLAVGPGRGVARAGGDRPGGQSDRRGRGRGIQGGVRTVVGAPDPSDLPSVMRASLDELKAVTAGK